MPQSQTGMEARPLRDAALAGVRHVAAGRAASELVALASSIVMARLLAPSEFGQAAVALVLLAFSASLMGSSFGTPLVQRKEITASHVRTSMLLSLLSGVFLSALVFFAAPLMRPVWGGDVTSLLLLMSPVFAVSSLGLVSHALLQRALDFRRIASIEVSSIVVRAVAQVVLAVAGFGAEALILGALAGSAVFALLLLRAAPGGWPGWDRACAREILGFGLPTAMSGLLSQTNRNLDYMILGALMSPAQVGQYWRGYQLGVEYQRKSTTVMTRMALPILSRAKHLSEMRRIRMHIMRTSSTLVFGGLAIFIAVAPQLVPWVFGPAWEPSVVPAQIFAVAGMAAATNAGASQLMLAVGRPKPLMYMSLVFFFIYGATIYFAAGGGLTVVCVAAASAQVLRTAAFQWLLLNRLIGIPLRDLWNELAPAAAGSAMLLAVAMPAAAVLDRAGVPAPITVAVAATGGVAVYAAVIRFLFPAAWAEAKELTARVIGVKGRRRRVPKAQPAASPARP